jgi:hypothetical protein
VLPVSEPGGCAGVGGAVHFGGVLELSAGGCLAGQAGREATGRGGTSDCAERACDVLEFAGLARSLLADAMTERQQKYANGLAE